MQPYKMIGEILKRNISVSMCADGRLKVAPVDAAKDLMPDMKQYRFILEMLASGKVRNRDGEFRVFPSCRKLLETGQRISDDPETRACFMCVKGDVVTFQGDRRAYLTGLCSEKRKAKNMIMGGVGR